MASKIKHTEAERDVMSLIGRIMMAADAPLPEMKFDDADLNVDLDDLPPLPTIVPIKPVGTPGTTLSLSGTHPICIRLSVRVIHAFKEQAHRTGGNYQSIMSRALKEAAAGFV